MLDGPGVYAVRERLIDGANRSSDAPFLVDIGGNLGHDVARFQKSRYPDAPGRLILQDLPMMIRQVKDLDRAIIRMEHDFNHEQPVRGKSEDLFISHNCSCQSLTICGGTRVYYIHSTLHNWPDHVCESILAQVRKAMEPGYSKLLINENVMPPTNAHWETTVLDMIVLTLLSSEQRTSTAWYDLVERRVGLKIVKIWSAGEGVESLIECELP